MHSTPPRILPAMTIRPLSPFLQKLIAHAVHEASKMPQTAQGDTEQPQQSSPADTAKLLDHRA
jgi:hypothetical protein